MKNIEPILCVFLLSVAVSIPVFAAVIELPEIINPASITVDNNHIYITDFPSVYIYSLKDCHLIKKFGRRGEGPGEWLRYALLSRHENYLVIGGKGKVIVEENVLDAEQHDVFYIPPGKWHCAFNPAENTEPFHLFILQAPRVSDELSEMGYVEITKTQWDKLGLPKKDWEK